MSYKSGKEIYKFKSIKTYDQLYKETEISKQTNKTFAKKPVPHSFKSHKMVPILCTWLINLIIGILQRPMWQIMTNIQKQDQSILAEYDEYWCILITRSLYLLTINRGYNTGIYSRISWSKLSRFSRVTVNNDTSNRLRILSTAGAPFFSGIVARTILCTWFIYSSKKLIQDVQK